MDSSLTIAEVRHAIDEADTVLLKALATRFRAIEHLKVLKKELRVATEDSARERDLKMKWKEQAKTLKISEELALLLLDFILAESKRMQDSDSD